jgi:hypothetical protein
LKIDCVAHAASDASDENAEVQPPPQKRQRLEQAFFGNLFDATTTGRVNKVDSYLVSRESADDVLNFWRSKAGQLPRLANVAKILLAIPATETSSERVFSIAGRTLEDRRSRLNPDTVDDLMFVHELNK